MLFFFNQSSTDGGLSWALLSDASSDQFKYIEMIRGPFIGDPSFVYKIAEAIPQDEQNLESEAAARDNAGESGAGDDEAAAGGDVEGGDDGKEEEEKKKKKKKNVRIISILEESRLAYFLKCIDHDTSVVPRGALLLNSYQEVVVNHSFTGQDLKKKRRGTESEREYM